MKQNRRRPSNAIDGFVPRNRVPQERRRVGLDRDTSARTADGFVAREENARKPIELGEGQWADENTLQIDNLDDINVQDIGRHPAAEKPHFWQFAKKRKLRKAANTPSVTEKVLANSARIVTGDTLYRRIRRLEILARNHKSV